MSRYDRRTEKCYDEMHAASGKRRRHMTSGWKKRTIGLSALTIAATLTAGSATGLIYVPVRVYDGNRFVDSLKPDDFQITVNGSPRNLESFAIVQKDRASGPAAAAPRMFLLCFEMDEVPPRLEKAIDEFFDNGPAENDIVLVQTPLDRWKFTIGPGGPAERRRLSAELKPLLLASIRRGGQTVRQRLMTLRDMAAFDGDEFMISWRARDIMGQMINEQTINETQYLAFADYFKTFPGRKDLLIFYREEAFSIPPLFLNDWRQLAAIRQESFDLKRIRTFFTDAGLTFHFIYLSKQKNAKTDIELRGDGPAMKGDFFQAFRDLAVTTGGITATTHDPVFGVRQATDAADNYYLLAFRPDSPGDESFKEISVKVKTGVFRVFHRAGFISR